MKKKQMYLVIDLGEANNIVDFDTSIKDISKRLGLNFWECCKRFERNYIDFKNFCIYGTILEEEKRPTGKYVIELYKEVPTIKNNFYVRHFPIITNLEQEKEYNSIYNKNKEQGEILERFEFDNVIDLFEKREDYIALGQKGKFKCYCEIKK